jgi:hypothetical protein
MAEAYLELEASALDVKERSRLGEGDYAALKGVGLGLAARTAALKGNCGNVDPSVALVKAGSGEQGPHPAAARAPSSASDITGTSDEAAKEAATGRIVDGN